MVRCANLPGRSEGLDMSINELSIRQGVLLARPFSLKPLEGCGDPGLRRQPELLRAPLERCDQDIRRLAAA